MLTIRFINWVWKLWPKVSFFYMYRKKYINSLYSFLMIIMKLLTLYKKVSTKGDFYQYFWSLSNYFASINVWYHGLLKKKSSISLNERPFRAGIIIHWALPITYQVLWIFLFRFLLYIYFWCFQPTLTYMVQENVDLARQTQT